jgi:DNA-binding NarL/FixJ family response regulator
VLSLMVHGKSNREDIAAALKITEATVKCHVSVILARLEVNGSHSGGDRGAATRAWSTCEPSPVVDCL